MIVNMYLHPAYFGADDTNGMHLEAGQSQMQISSMMYTSNPGVDSYFPEKTFP